ncbi:MAG: hypothetical protein SV760_09695 [Halobacteria archaeon]|nr:hypothetical protein [Halobacteria archaeon]
MSRKLSVAPAVVSVVLVVCLSTGAVVAGSVARGSGGVGYPENSTGSVGPGATLFQGEDSLNLTGGLSLPLVGVENTSTEGERIESLPIPNDQKTGVYRDGDGDRIDLKDPKVTLVEIYAPEGNRVNGSEATGVGQNLLVVADWNYKKVEDITVEVENAEGEEVTRDAVDDLDITPAQREELARLGGSTSDYGTLQQGIGNTDLGGDQVAAWTLSFEGLGPGRYKVTVGGIEESANTTNFDFRRSGSPPSSVGTRSVRIVDGGGTGADETRGGNSSTNESRSDARNEEKLPGFGVVTALLPSAVVFLYLATDHVRQ